MKLKKGPLKFQKIKNSYNEHSNQKVIENRPPKSGYSDSLSNFKIFKSPNKTQKRPPKISKNKNSYKEHSNKKVIENRPKKSPPALCRSQKEGRGAPKLVINGYFVLRYFISIIFSHCKIDSNMLAKVLWRLIGIMRYFSGILLGIAVNFGKLP